MFGGAQRGALSRIERGYYPALQTQQRLQGLLGSLQRRLQDAAAASDVDGLAEADSLRNEFQRALDGAAANPVASKSEITRLRNDFSGYYDVARHTTETMIAGGANDALSGNLETMRASFAALRLALDSATARRTADVTREFAAARQLNTRTESGTLLITLITLLACSALSVVIIRGVTRALRRSVAVAERLAEGDTSVKVAAETQDEVGQLLTSMASVIRTTESMADAAARVAGGDLTVEVRPRPGRD